MKDKPPIKRSVVVLEGETEAKVVIETEDDKLKWDIIVKVSEAMVPYFKSKSCLTVREEL